MINRIVIFTTCALTLLITALSTLYFLISYKPAVYFWMSYVFIQIFIICGCNIGIWRKFRLGSITSQQNRFGKQTPNKDLVVCIYSCFVVLATFPYFQLFNTFIWYPDTVEILSPSDRCKLLQLFCESSCLRIKNT